MRYLRLFRERALFCFGAPYFCVFQHTTQELMDEAQQIGYPDILRAPGYSELPINNGERLAIEVPDTAFRFVIAIYRESMPLISETVEIPAGQEDFTFVIKTEYNGRNHIALHVEPMEA